MATLKRVFTLRLSGEVYDKIRELAAQECRSMTNYIEYVLASHIQKRERDSVKGSTGENRRTF